MGLFGRRRPEPAPPADAFTTAATRAAEAWRALLASCVVRGPTGVLTVKEGPARSAAVAAVWPAGQVLAAAVDLRRLPWGGDRSEELLGAIERYRVGPAYAPFPGSPEHYHDDNAWIGLVLAQLAAETGAETHLAGARRVLATLEAGAAPGGGIRWREGVDSVHTCSTAPAVQLALRVHLLTGDPDALAFAEHQHEALDRLLRGSDGLYRDNVDARGRVEPTLWSYNQGTPIGAAVLRFRISGDTRFLERAVETADATLDHFGVGDRWWTHPPVFNAIFFRNLLTLAAIVPQDRYLAVLDSYLERVWLEARDPATGLFTGAGIGSYDRRPTIDQAGLVQLYALRAWPPELWPDIC